MKFNYITKPENILQVPFRWFSTLIVRVIARTSITPNQVTIFRGAVVVVGLFLMARGHPWDITWGAVLFYIFEVLDHVDGDLARYTNQKSRIGPLLEQFQDTIFARPSNLLGAALAIGAYRQNADLLPGLLFGICAYGRMNWMEFRDYFGWQRSVEKREAKYLTIFEGKSFRQSLEALVQVLYIWNNTFILVPALCYAMLPPTYAADFLRLGFLAVAALNNLPWIAIIVKGFRQAMGEDSLQEVQRAKQASLAKADSSAAGHPDICLLSCLVSIRDSHTRHYMRVLVRHGYVVMSIRPGTLDGDLKEIGVLHCELPEVGYHFWPEGTPFLQILGAMRQRCGNMMRATGALMCHRPRIVMSMEPDSLLLAILLKPFLGHRVVADLRELYEDRLLAFPGWMQPPLRWLFRRSMRVMSHFADEIVHVSEERKAEYPYLAKAGVVIVYYPDPLVFETEGNRGGAGKEEITVLHAGPLRNSYGANELLEAIQMAREQVDTIRLVVVGGKLQELQREDLLAALIQQGTVRMVGTVSSSEVSRYMASADIGVNLVLPVDRTHILAQPRKLFEYLIAGLPVVGANVPTISRVLRESQCGLIVDPCKPREIADAFVSLARDKSLRERLGLQARKAALERYNWATQEKSFLEIFRRLHPKGHAAVVSGKVGADPVKVRVLLYEPLLHGHRGVYLRYYRDSLIKGGYEPVICTEMLPEHDTPDLVEALDHYADKTGCDLIHVLTFEGLGPLWLQYKGALARKGRPIIVSYYLYDNLYKPFKGFMWDILFARGLLNRILVSDDFLSERTLPPWRRRRISYVPDTWSPAEFPSIPKGEARLRLGLEEGHVIFLIFGALQRRKGIELLLEALVDLQTHGKSVRVLLAGHLDNYYKQGELAEKMALLRARGLLRIDDGFVEERAVSAYFHAADFVVCPYAHTFQASSNVYTRACAAGIPAIVPDHGVMGKLVRRTGAGLAFESKSAASLRECMQRAMDLLGSDKLNAIIAAGRILAEAKQLSRFDASVIEAYRLVIADKAAATAETAI